MKIVFSHIIQKRLSQENEDVATDALAYVLEASEAAQRGMTKLLRGIVPDMPSLRFKTQQTEFGIRPDMTGSIDGEVRVFVENKFWAGLGETQPISYLKRLESYAQPTVLLVIAPSARANTMERELRRRLAEAGITGSAVEGGAGISFSFVTQTGPIIALTSWGNVLTTLEHESVEDASAKADLCQLRGLCDAADNEAFTPFSREDLSDQRIPSFILQLNSIVQNAIDSAETKNFLSTTSLRPQASWERIGRYVWIPEKHRACAWLGVHFGLWKSIGTSPLWLLFSDESGRAPEVCPLIEPWARENNILTTLHGQWFGVALEIPDGEEESGVVFSLVNQIQEISTCLHELPPKMSVSLQQE